MAYYIYNEPGELYLHPNQVCRRYQSEHGFNSIVNVNEHQAVVGGNLNGICGSKEGSL